MPGERHKPIEPPGTKIQVKMWHIYLQAKLCGHKVEYVAVSGICSTL